jgi:DNA-binding MarR family transcriptional regulator
MATTSDTTAVELTPALDELRTALSQMFGAERRLRGRDHAPGELTHAHIRSLHALHDAGELTAGQLAKSADLNPASVTAMLDQLEDSEIVSRSRSTTDRRVTIVSLTPKGRKLLADKTAKWLGMWRSHLEGFSEDELETATRVVREIGALMDSVAIARAADVAQRAAD